MPIYEYRAADPEKSCPHCKEKFEIFHKKIGDLLTNCPKCNAPVNKLVSSFGVAYGLDFRAKGTGLSKLVRRDKGTYEKMY